MIRRVFLATLAASAFCVSAGSASAQDAQFRITTNNPQGAGFSLDVGDLVGNGLSAGAMLPTSQALGQYWRFRQGAGGLRLTNALNGPNQCLDTAQDGTLYMAPCGIQLGQRWSLVEVPGVGVRFVNSFKPGHCLDYVAQHSPVLNTNIGIMVMQPCNGSAQQAWTVAHTGRR